MTSQAKRASAIRNAQKSTGTENRRGETAITHECAQAWDDGEDRAAA